MNTSTQVVTIDFHGQPMIAIQNGDEIYVAMKPICEALQIDWRSQRQRIKRHPVMSKGVVIMNTPSEGGDQETATLPLKMLNGWLFGIDASRVKPESRAKLIEYQTECFDVLANYFMQGAAINPRTPYAANPGDSLTKDQADALRQMLTEAAKKACPGDTKKQGAFIMRGWSKLKSHFKVGYRQIPQGEFTEAVSLLARHVIEGEYLPREEVRESETINETVQKWAAQIEAGNGLPAELFAPIVEAVAKKKAGSGNGSASTPPAGQPQISLALHEHIARKTHATAMQQYDTIRAIITDAVQSNLNCGATEEEAHDCIEAYGDLSSGVVVANRRDVVTLARQAVDLLNQAGKALEVIRQFEKHLGQELFSRKEADSSGLPGLPMSFVERAIGAA